MIFSLFERTSKIPVDFENSDFYSSSLHYYSQLQTNCFYAKTVQFSP